MFPTDLAGRNLTYGFNSVSVVISSFMRKLLRLIQLVFLASLLLPLLTLWVLGELLDLPKLYNSSDWLWWSWRVMLIS